MVFSRKWWHECSDFFGHHFLSRASWGIVEHHGSRSEWHTNDSQATESCDRGNGINAWMLSGQTQQVDLCLTMVCERIVELRKARQCLRTLRIATTAVLRQQSEVFRRTHDVEVPQVLSGWVVVACCDKMTRRGRCRRLGVKMVRLDREYGEFLRDHHCSIQKPKGDIQVDSRFGSPTGVVRMGGRCLW